MRREVCGISGVLDPRRSTPGEELAALAEKMAATVTHRGPDDRGSFVDAEAGVAFGFRRLSIIDLSATGHQPMTSASGRFVIAFNGEVYNAPALRRALEDEGRAP